MMGICAASEAFAEGRGLFPVEDLGLVTVSGADRLTWLTSLSSQVFTAGTCVESLFLDPQGRIRFVVGGADDGDKTWLFLEGGAPLAAEFASFLQSMQFLLDVEVADVSAQYQGFSWLARSDSDTPRPAVLWPVPRPAVSWPAPRPAVAWIDPWPGITLGGTSYSTARKHPANSGFRRVLAAVPRDQAQAFQANWLESHPDSIVVDSNAALAWQIVSWRPGQAMLDDKSMPAEFDWLRTAVHLDKGCYCGQESVARILNLGKPPRRLVFLHLDGSTNYLPPAGQDVYLASSGVQGRPVGRIVAAAIDHDMGPIALALVRRAVPIDVPLCLAGDDPEDPLTACSQEEIVSVDGRADRSPKERPGARLRPLPALKPPTSQP